MITTLKEEREKHHYSLQTMANKLGISKTYYWQLEYGKRRLLYSLAEEMAKYLNITPSFYSQIESEKRRLYYDTANETPRSKLSIIHRMIATLRVRGIFYQ